jgi:hypothetical protein
MVAVGSWWDLQHGAGGGCAPSFAVAFTIAAMLVFLFIVNNDVGVSRAERSMR